jgi:hypothetical protein
MNGFAQAQVTSLWLFPFLPKRLRTGRSAGAVIGPSIRFFKGIITDLFAKKGA